MYSYFLSLKKKKTNLEDNVILFIWIKMYFFHYFLVFLILSLNNQVATPNSRSFNLGGLYGYTHQMFSVSFGFVGSHGLCGLSQTGCWPFNGPRREKNLCSPLGPLVGLIGGSSLVGYSWALNVPLLGF